MMLAKKSVIRDNDRAFHQGGVSERLKELVLKTREGNPFRGFESHPLRQPMLCPR